MGETISPDSILEMFSSLQGGGKDIQAEFRTLTQEEKDWFVYSRLMRILSTVRNSAWNAANDLDGLNHNVEKKSIYVSNMMNGVKFLANAMGVAKADIDLPDLEQQMGTTSPEDEAALRFIKIPFEWQQEPGGEVIKTEVGLWDVLSVWLDVNTMREFEQFVEGDETTIRKVLEDYFPLTDPNREKEIKKLVETLRSGEILVMENGQEVVYSQTGDKSIARDVAFDAIIMRRVLKFALGLGERDRFPGLPEYTSLLTPIGFPVENLRYDSRIKDPEGTETTYLWDALGPLVFAAEGVAGVTGDFHIERQDIGVWSAMQSHRAFMSEEAYETDTYSTTSYLATDALDMTVIYDALLHRYADKGVEATLTQFEFQDAKTGEARRLTKDEVDTVVGMITMEILFDPRGMSFMVCQKPAREFGQFLKGARKMIPRSPSGPAERRARPIGTWGRVARAYVESHPGDFGGQKQLFKNVDFFPLMEQLGIQRHLRDEIKSKGTNVGGHVGKEGLVTLLQYLGLRVAKIPYTPRMLRNWFHYAKSVDVTVQGNIKPATEMVLQSSVSDVDLQRMMGYREMGKAEAVVDQWIGDDRAMQAAVQIEIDTAQLLHAAMLKMADPQNAAAFRFKEGPEETSYIVDQSLLTMIQAHLVFPTSDMKWMQSSEMRELQQVIPSAGYVLEPDWNDFVKSGGKQLRPKRITKKDLGIIVNNLNRKDPSLHETVDQREKDLLDLGYYWMPWKSKYDKNSQLTLHHPTRKPVRSTVTLPDFFNGLRDALGQLEEKARRQGRTKPNDEIQQRIQRYRSLLQGKTFSPVHLEGIYAFPGEAWREMVSTFEETGSGTPFLKSGDLDSIRTIITLYEQAGLLPPNFTTVRTYDLRRNRINPDVIQIGRQKVTEHVKRLSSPISLPAHPLIKMNAPGHVRVRPPKK